MKARARSRSLWLAAFVILLSSIVPISNPAYADTDNNSVLKDAQEASWIAQGSGKQIVYVIFDANCPYCHVFYKESQSHLKDAQFRWIPVGLLADTSAGKAAAMLSASNPEAALRKNEDGFELKHDGMGGIEELKKIPADIQLDLGENLDLLAETGPELVPKIIYQDANGKAHVITGALSSDELDMILKGTGGKISASGSVSASTKRKLKQ